jgi:uncharacterized protein (UPF0218 family)
MATPYVTMKYLDTALARLRDEIRDELRSEFGTVVTHFANVVIEQTRAMFDALGDKIDHYAAELRTLRREFDEHRADDRIHRRPRVRPSRR